jgi:hypothetical protein
LPLGKKKKKEGLVTHKKEFFWGKKWIQVAILFRGIKKEKEKSHLDHLGSSMSQKYS